MTKYESHGIEYLLREYSKVLILAIFVFTVLSDCNGTRTYKHLVRKRTLSDLAKLT